jgi:hypothetical protein
VVVDGGVPVTSNVTATASATSPAPIAGTPIRHDS